MKIHKVTNFGCFEGTPMLSYHQMLLFSGKRLQQEDGAGAGGYAKESSKEFQEARRERGAARELGTWMCIPS